MWWLIYVLEVVVSAMSIWGVVVFVRTHPGWRPPEREAKSITLHAPRPVAGPRRTVPGVVVSSRRTPAGELPANSRRISR